MRIDRIRFANYRGIPEFELDVREHLVLVGPNDSGKSSILLGLHLLLGTYGSQLPGSLAPGDFTDQRRMLVVEADLVDFADPERAAFPDEIAVTETGERLRIRLEASVSDVEPDTVLIERTFPESGLTRSLSREQLAAIGWKYVPAARSLYRELGGSRSGVMRSLLASVQLGDERGTVVEALKKLKDAVDGLTSIGGFRSDLAGALSEALPRVVSPEDVGILLPGELSDDPLAEAQVGLVGEQGMRTLNEQSDGIRALATIAAYGLAHFGANVVAIDEPEMHLHPTAQKLVARRLRAGSPQAVVATHSSSIASEFPPTDIAVLRPGRTVSQLASVAPAAGPAFAARWWQDQFVQPLTARCLVIVEGPTDRILVTAVAGILGLNLHQRGVHVLDLNGADNFKHAISAFGPEGFDVRVVGLLDEDHREDWARVLDVAPEDLEELGYRICRPDLEGVVVEALGAGRVIELMVASGLYGERAVLGALGAAERDEVTDEQIVGYLQGRHKAQAAAALAAEMENEDALRLTPLVELLGLSLE